MRNGLRLLIAILMFWGGGLHGSPAYLCGTPEVWLGGTDTFQRQLLLRRDVSDGRPAMRAPELPAVNPVLAVGMERTFFAPDFGTLRQYRVATVLRGVGRFCYVFVEETEWNTRVTPATVRAILRAFDAAVPANPQGGIYETLTERFGLPPDIDGNGRVILVLLNIRDKANGDHYIAGFFNPADQSRGVLRPPGVGGFPIRSNAGEILYMDTRPLNPDSETAHSVIAHEFQHLLNWHWDRKEATWVDEGCALYGAFLCGYSLQEQIRAFERRPTVSLITWRDANPLPHYGAAFLWMLYLHERYGGVATVAEVVRNRGTSLTGMANALARRGVGESVSDIFVSWKVANYLSDYEAVTLSLSPRRWHRSYPSGTQAGDLYNFSADYIGFDLKGTGSGGLTLGFSSGAAVPNTDVRAIAFYTTGAVEVREFARAMGNTRSLVLPAGVTEAVLVPSLQRESLPLYSDGTAYEYSARRGGKPVALTTTALPNAVHPRYWDILATSTEALVGVVPRVTFTGDTGTPSGTFPLFRDVHAMYPVTQGSEGTHVYRFTFLLEPEIEPASVVFHILLDSRVVDTGTLTE